MSVLFSKLAFPLYHWAKRDGVNAAIRKQDRAQWLPPSELRALQRQRLSDLLSFSGRHVPYYRGLIKSLGLPPLQLADPQYFSRFPILTKDLIRSADKRLVSENLSRNGLTPNDTSGSTGEPLRFFTDYQSATTCKAAEIRGKRWTGWRSVSLWGSPIDEQRHGNLRARIHGWMTGSRLLSSYDLSRDMMDRYIDEIYDFEPVLLVSYAGPLEQLAIHCLERGVCFASLKGIITSAEKLWPHQRATIEEAFGLPIFDRYGSREFGIIAQECDARNGLHIFVDRIYLELVNNDGQPCAPGESGRILLTDLDNYGSPMIRYEIGDRATWSSSSACPCGRGLPLLEQIDGRTLEVVSTPTGNRIGGTFWTLLFRSRPGIRQFQVIQEQLEGVQIYFVPDTVFDPECLDYFRRKIIEKSGDGFSVEFVEVDRIDLTESGKKKLVVSRCGVATN